MLKHGTNNVQEQVQEQVRYQNLSMDGLMPRAHGRAGAVFTSGTTQRLGALA
ncbi:MAG: hypothetical protein ACYCVD_00635 [Desulfitobacteriaceae bacterium]